MSARSEARAAREQAADDAWVEATVAKAPPLNEAQREIIRAAFATLDRPAVRGAA